MRGIIQPKIIEFFTQNNENFFTNEVVVWKEYRVQSVVVTFTP